MNQKTSNIVLVFLLLLLFVQGDDGCSIQSRTQSVIDLFEGESATLSCTISCGTVVWFLNGSIIPKATSTLFIPSVNQTWAGKYECSVNLTNGTLLSRQWVANITVRTINAPADQYALIGTGITLKCTVDVASTLIQWYSFEDPSVNGSSSISITNVSTHNEHSYICNIVKLSGNIIKNVYLHVTVPPQIIASPQRVINILSNSPDKITNISMSFNSKPVDFTSILWLKNGILLNPAVNITTQIGKLSSLTTLILPQMLRRADSGNYTIIIQNTFDNIPVTTRNITISFVLNIKVLPTMPANVEVTMINSSQILISWLLESLALDASANYFNVQMKYQNGSIAKTIIVPRGVQQAILATSPATNYTAEVTAFNTDGSVAAQPLSFTTPPGAAYLSSISAHRYNLTTLYFFMNFAFNGGSDIIGINVSHRPFHSQWRWSTSVFVKIATFTNVSAEAVMDVTHQYYPDCRHEFKIVVLNGLLFQSEEIEFSETVDLPGPPSTPYVTNYNGKPSSVVVQLSVVGSPPILQVKLVIMTAMSTFHWIMNNSGPYLPGEFVTFNLSDLADSSSYTFIACADNCAGEGPCSPQSTILVPLNNFILPFWSIFILTLTGITILSGLVTIVTCAQRTNLQEKRKRMGISQDSVASCVKIFPPLATPLVPRSPTVKARCYDPKSSTPNTPKGALVINNAESLCSVFIPHYEEAGEPLKHCNARDFEVYKSPTTDV